MAGRLVSMTNKNTNWKPKPFLLSPVGKDYLWGGERLKTDFRKNMNISPLAETWECSTHPDGPSHVASGEHINQSLPHVLAAHPEYLGSHPTAIMQGLGAGSPDMLPILVKLIDAREKLSVQVHPDDTYAAANEKGSLGKTEMWYVLDAAPGAHLIYGFNRDMDETLLRRSLETSTLDKYLQKIPVQKDDVFYIEAGTVHAIGEGVLLAEIQENSNLTYRLHDYNRKDKDGNMRTLHVDKAVQALNYRSSESPRQPMRVLRYHPGCASELLCRCKYFQVERLLLNTSPEGLLPDCTTTALSFQVLLCIEGGGELLMEDGETLCYQKGSCIFVPADSMGIRLTGQAQLLRISC